MSPPLGKSRDSAQARLLGSGTSGVAELLVFHPVDTVAKRLMSNKDASIKVRIARDKAWRGTRATKKGGYGGATEEAYKQMRRARGERCKDARQEQEGERWGAGAGAEKQSLDVRALLGAACCRWCAERGPMWARAVSRRAELG